MHLELFKDKSGKCRIRLRAKNGKILMTSDDPYASKRNAKDTMISILHNRWFIVLVDKTVDKKK